MQKSYASDGMPEIKYKEALEKQVKKYYFRKLIFF
jgi:hypothetical protein